MELVNCTCEWPNSQLDPPLVASLRRVVVNHSIASYVVRHEIGRKSLLKFLSHANFCRVRQVTRGGRAQSLVGRLSVAKHHRSVRGRSQVYHSGRAVVVILGPEFMPIDLRMACEGRELAGLSWCDRKSLLLLGQWYTFYSYVSRSLNFDVNASLRSNDKSLTTAHESKKFIIFQLVNLSEVGRDSV